MRHADLFRSCQCDAIIPTEDIGAKLVVQEVQDPGVAPLIAELLSNLEGSELYSETTDVAGYSFGDVQIALIKMNVRIIPIALIKDERKLINPPSNTIIETNDRLVIISRERQDFSAIKADVKKWLAENAQT